MALFLPIHFIRRQYSTLKHFLEEVAAFAFRLTDLVSPSARVKISMSSLTHSFPALHFSDQDKVLLTFFFPSCLVPAHHPPCPPSPAPTGTDLLTGVMALLSSLPFVIAAASLSHLLCPLVPACLTFLQRLVPRFSSSQKPPAAPSLVPTTPPPKVSTPFFSTVSPPTMQPPFLFCSQKERGSEIFGVRGCLKGA